MKKRFMLFLCILFTVMSLAGLYGCGSSAATAVGAHGATGNPLPQPSVDCGGAACIS
ncbi:MAG: hypothetical protein ISR96_03495 [Nitrospira sp.]|nr:hypothetical protein [Nitrospira sp.]